MSWNARRRRPWPRDRGATGDSALPKLLDDARKWAFPSEPEEPVYGCDICQDSGVQLLERRCHLGYVATYARPCDQCELGLKIAGRMKREMVAQVAASPGARYRNRKLRFQHLTEVDDETVDEEGAEDDSDLPF